MDEATLKLFNDEVEAAQEALGEAVSDNDYAEAAKQQHRIEVLEEIFGKLVG